MSRRIPLWLTLVPLLAAGVIYWIFWTGWARDFQAALEPWLPDSTLEITGFPYRLEANVANPRLVTGDAVKITASAAKARINRGPWQPQLTVISAERPRFTAIVSPAIAATITGKSATTSIKIIDAKLARASSIIAAANISLAGMPITADSLELHLRERIPGPNADSAATPSAPIGPPRGQLVIAGERLRFGTGDPLTLAADIVATGPARLLAYDNWAATGTLELGSLTLTDAHGEIASARASFVPIGRTALRFAGTITTICPANVTAALQGQAPVSEKRLRTPLKLTFEGRGADIRLTGIPADIATRPTRNQLPPCPALRR
nr:DUF2125 domain-containing protein [Polymorphobacter sp.]